MKLAFHTAATLAGAMLLSACGSAESEAAPAGEATAEVAAEAAPQAASADNPLTTWCMETGSQEACECADGVLRDASADEDYEIYQSLAPTYLERRAAGDGREAAFDASSAEATERLGMSTDALRDVTNRMGRQQRDAIKQCEG